MCVCVCVCGGSAAGIVSGEVTLSVLLIIKRDNLSNFSQLSLKENCQ